GVVRAARDITRPPDRPRADRPALEGDPLPPRGLPGTGRDRDRASDQHRGWHPHQGAVRAVPPETGQEARLRGRTAQATRLRVRGETDMTTTTETSTTTSTGA